jgi:hypothetical protein
MEAGPGDASAADQPGAGAASEEELRRRLEDQLRKVRVQDLLLESVVSILNLSARRIANEDERDLEQARVGIDAVRAVVELIDEGPRVQVTEALSQVQMLYAREAQGEPPQEQTAEGEGAAQPPPAEGQPPPRRPSGLWTPPGT